jgi:putative holliday junction resolvase
VDGFARGVRIGVDIGDVRIGLAISDPDGVLATPLATLHRDRRPDNTGIPREISELERLVEAHGIVEVVVGLPTTLAGAEGAAAAAARDYARRLQAAIAPVPVTMADERMSTVVATRKLSGQGIKGRRRRAVVDQAAAVEILQGWLDAHRRRTER